MTDFPPEFLWGSATAAHQVEGGNTGSDWWAWENAPGSTATEPSGEAIDHFRRYDEDFALLAELGHNAHRLSVEWARIEPTEGAFSSAALDHYARVLESLAGHGLTAFVTMHHFTLPQWFAERGGWLAPDALDLFGRYVARVTDRLGDLMPFVCTVNEPQALALLGHVAGVFPPGHTDVEEGLAVNARLMQAHRTAVAAVRAGRGSSLIGLPLFLPPVEPLDPDDEPSVQLADLMRAFMVDSHLDDLQAGGDVGDWVGLHYYTRLRVDAALEGFIAPPPEGAETTLMGWEVYPAGFRGQLERVASVGLPIYITENGIATADDSQRLRFLVSHLTVLKEAMDAGVDVRGYLHWSAFDNFEWAHGYAPTFGLVGIDRSDGMRRIVRPSARAYARLARSGRLAALTES